MTSPSDRADWMNAPPQSAPADAALRPSPVALLRRARAVVHAADSIGFLRSVGEPVPTSPAALIDLSRRLLDMAHALPPQNHSPERDAILLAAFPPPPPAPAHPPIQR